MLLACQNNFFFLTQLFLTERLTFFTVRHLKRKLKALSRCCDLENEKIMKAIDVTTLHVIDKFFLLLLFSILFEFCRRTHKL